jgi:hypothetical protein
VASVALAGRRLPRGTRHRKRATRREQHVFAERTSDTAAYNTLMAVVGTRRAAIRWIAVFSNLKTESLDHDASHHRRDQGVSRRERVYTVAVDVAAVLDRSGQGCAEINQLHFRVV